MAQGKETGAAIEEELSLFDRAKQFGTDVLEMVEQSFHERRQKALAFLAVGSTALGGGLAVEMLNTGLADAAANRGSHSCVKYDNKALVFSAANKAVMPIASDVINAYHKADRSEVKIKKDQPELGGLTYRKLTEVDITVPAKSTNGDAGTYTYAAQFLGKITPKDMIAVELGSYVYKNIGTDKVERPVYGFLLAKTDGDFENPHIGLQWRMQHSYTNGSYDADSLVISRLASGAEITGFYAMTTPILNTGTHQAEGLLDDMTKHLHITSQKNLNVTMRSPEVCP